MLDRSDRDLDIAMSGDDDHRHIRIVPLDRLENIDAVHLTVFEPDIEDHERRRFLVHLGHRLVRGSGQPGREALVFQNVRDKLANVPFVIDY